MKGIVKFLHMKTFFDDFFSEMLIEKKTLVCRKTVMLAISSDIEVHFLFENVLIKSELTC